MMDKEKIRETANRYCKETDCTQEETSLITEGFIEGVHWAQEEFKKSLWHDASEEPEKNKLIIEKIFDEHGYDYELDCPTYSCRTWVEMVKIFDIIKWCYLDDILPQKSMKATT